MGAADTFLAFLPVTKYFAVAAKTVAMLTCAGNSASVSVPVEK